MPPPYIYIFVLTFSSLPAIPYFASRHFFARVLSASNIDQVSRSVGGRGPRDVAATTKCADTIRVHGEPAAVWFLVPPPPPAASSVSRWFYTRKTEECKVWNSVTDDEFVSASLTPVPTWANVKSMYGRREIAMQEVGNVYVQLIPWLRIKSKVVVLCRVCTRKWGIFGRRTKPCRSVYRTFRDGLVGCGALFLK